MLPDGNILRWIADRLIEFLKTLEGPLGPLVDMMLSTPLAFTTGNALVMAGWRTMTIVADVLFGLFIVIGTIQIMYGDTTGTIRMPIGQFVSKALLTALLIHLSALFGEQLLILNNLLCGLVGEEVRTFMRQVNHGQLFNDEQTLVLSLVMVVVFGISFLRVIFQALTRVVRFNLLFVLSGPAFLTSFHPATAPVFSSWIRLYVITIFEQFLQLLTFGLGLQFLLATKLTGLTGFVLAVAMLNLTAQIPKLLERFGAAAGQGGGMGQLASIAIRVVTRLL